MAGLPRSEGRSGPAATESATKPPALRASIAFGIVGAILLAIGFVSGALGVLVAATVAGVSSLVCALIWRAQLIEAWRKEYGRPTRDW